MASAQTSATQTYTLTKPLDSLSMPEAEQLIQYSMRVDVRVEMFTVRGVAVVQIPNSSGGCDYRVGASDRVYPNIIAAYWAARAQKGVL